MYQPFSVNNEFNLVLGELTSEELLNGWEMQWDYFMPSLLWLFQYPAKW